MFAKLSAKLSCCISLKKKCLVVYHSTEMSTFLSLDFTEILQLKYTLGLQFFIYFKIKYVI